MEAKDVMMSLHRVAYGIGLGFEDALFLALIALLLPTIELLATMQTKLLLLWIRSCDWEYQPEYELFADHFRPANLIWP